MLYFNNATVDLSVLSHLNQWSLNGQTHYYIIQFSGESSEIFPKLQSVSQVLRFVPHNGYIVRVKGSLDELKNIKNVESIIPYSPYLKVEKRLFKEATEEKLVLNINLFPGADTHSVIQKLFEDSIEVIDTSLETIQVGTLQENLPQIAAIDGVEWIEEQKEMVLPVEPLSVGGSKDPGDEKFEMLNGFATGAKVLKPEKLYETKIRGEGELVTLTDSGLDRGRFDDLPLDLKGRVKKAISLGRPKTGNWNDPLGHGTHVAGLIAGDGRSSKGHVRGVAFESELFMQSAFKWLTRDGKIMKGMESVTTVDHLLSPAYEAGSRIHTNSWHYVSDGSYGIQSSRLDEFIWKHPDMVVLFAAGNNGVDLNDDGRVDEASIATPSNAKNCITVGASENFIIRGGFQRAWSFIGRLGLEGDKNKWGTLPLRDDLPSDNINGLAAFSSRGPTSDGRLKPDLVAPGTNNLSLRSRAKEVNVKESWGEFNPDYIFMGGTSMATPLVAGSAALVRQYYRVVEKKDNPSSALIKAALIHGALDLYPGQFVGFKEIPARRPNVHEGFGRVNLEDIIPSLPFVRYSIDHREGLCEKESLRYAFRVGNMTYPLRVTLVYTDFPSSPAVSRALVNDLDVVVKDSKGNTFYPNGLVKPDRVNNVEDIEIQDPQLGNYMIEVNAYAVPFGMGEKRKQPFALVISGAIELTYERGEVL